MGNNNIDNILKAADYVIKCPSTTVMEACSNFGVSVSPVTGFVMGTIICQSPVISGMLWVYNKIAKNRRETQEKERMKNEIIRKQQAIIRKLQRENELNQKEIKNLKDTLEMLEDVVSRMNAA